MINGFGKSIGLMQVEELGVLETPIALTNTFGVAAVAQAQIRAAIQAIRKSDVNGQRSIHWSSNATMDT